MIKSYKDTYRRILAFFLAVVMSVSIISVHKIIEARANADFQATLESFPVSYRPYLTVLHEKYPNWKFEPVNTGLEWSEVIKNEMVLSRNLVPYYSLTVGGTPTRMTLKGVDKSETGGEYWYYTPTSWKETEMNGSYNWAGNDWVRFDSGWAQASKVAVEYIIDPRNWINDTSIFMFEKLSYDSATQTKEILKKMMDDTFMDCDYAKVPGSDNKTYADVLIEAANTYNVNPISLCTRIIQEKGRGTYNATTKVYELKDTLGSGVSSSDGGSTFHPKKDGETAYYNFFNIGASGTGNQVIINNGGKEAMKEGWTSPYLAILGGSKKFVSGYIAIGQDTLYFQKFSVVNDKYLYWKQYMQNLLAPVNEGYTVMNAYKNSGMIESSFTFRIPVYKNMPESVCKRPEPTYSTGNPNYKLSGISVKGTDLFGNTQNIAITPTFNMDTDTYSIVIPYAVNKINISASSISDKAKIEGVGAFDVPVGTNTYRIKCTSEIGTSKVYNLNITRSSGSTLFKDITTTAGGFEKPFDKLVTEYEKFVGYDIEKLQLKLSTETDYAKVVLVNTDLVYNDLIEEETTPEETTPEETTPEETTPEETTPEETTPEETTTGETAPEGTVSETTTPEVKKPGEEKPGAEKPSAEKPGAEKPKPEKPGDAKAEETTTPEETTTAEPETETFEVSESGISHKVYDKYTVKNGMTPEIYLKEGENTITIDVYPSADDETTKTTYVIKIFRYGNTEYDLKDIQIKDNLAYNFVVGDTVKKVIDKIKITNGRIDILDKDGKVKASDALIATGDKLKIYDRNGYCMLTYDVVIYGDVSGDGKIDVFDFAYVRKLIIKNTGLSGIYLEAANVNKQSETVDIFDFATIRRFIIKGVAIEQK